MPTSKPYTGVYPIAPVPFHDDESLDLDGMRRVLDCMIDQGVDGICILANYSEQFLLSDEEREALLRLSAGTHCRPRTGDRYLLALLDWNCRGARAHGEGSGRSDDHADATPIMARC